MWAFLPSRQDSLFSIRMSLMVNEGAFNEGSAKEQQVGRSCKLAAEAVAPVVSFAIRTSATWTPTPLGACMQ